MKVDIFNLTKDFFLLVLFILPDVKKKTSIVPTSTSLWSVSFPDQSLSLNFPLSLYNLQQRDQHNCSVTGLKLSDTNRKLRKIYDLQGGIKDHDTWKRIKYRLYEKIAGLGMLNFASWRKIWLECLKDLASVKI